MASTVEGNNSNAETLFEMMIKVENKDIFVDLKKNKIGSYLKISERRNGSGRNTVLIPSSGISKLRLVLDEVAKISITDTKTISKERKQRVAGDPDVTSRSVYVTGLPYDTNEDELTAHFSSQGDEVVKATILRQNRRGIVRSMGCGVVEFSSNETALKIIDKFNETELGGRQIKCREDRDPEASNEAENGNAHEVSAATSALRQNATKPKREKVSNGASTSDRELDNQKVFVANIPWDATQQDLINLFSTVGEVVSAEVLSTKKGRAMGSGIVEFAEPESASAAISQLSGKELSGRTIIVRSCYK